MEDLGIDVFNGLHLGRQAFCLIGKGITQEEDLALLFCDGCLHAACLGYLSLLGA
jgi:hypothetical protein